MAPYYTMNVYDSSGTLQAVVTNFLTLSISKQLNAIDMLQFTIDNSAYAAQYLDMGAFVSIYRQDVELGIPNQLEFSGLIRKKVTIKELRTKLVVTCVGWLALLADRVIAYKSNAANLSVFKASPAETILKRLFNFNIGSLATTANGRLLDGRVTGMTTSASTNTGTALTLKCSMQPLLKTMQEIAYTGGMAFTLTYTAPATWTYTTYLGQIGTDRTSSITLSVGTGTVAKITQNYDIINDFNTVITGGNGTEDAKLFSVRPGTLPTGLDLRETYVDAKNQQNATVSYLNQFGNKTLAIQQRKRVTYAVDVLQTSEMRYGRDYFFGDKINVAWNSTAIPQYVYGVGLEWKSTGDEVVSVKLNS
jgi:Siphovirus ReqiPepy6 Gp37-like protein